jgi:hypothetical protein
VSGSRILEQQEAMVLFCLNISGVSERDIGRERESKRVFGLVWFILKSFNG